MHHTEEIRALRIPKPAAAHHGCSGSLLVSLFCGLCRPWVFFNCSNFMFETVDIGGDQIRKGQTLSVQGSTRTAKVSDTDAPLSLRDEVLVF